MVNRRSGELQKKEPDLLGTCLYPHPRAGCDSSFFAMAQVVDDVDLWAAVLSYLQLPHALNAAQTCRAHLFTALHRARMPCGRLALQLRDARQLPGSTITEWIGNGRECTSRLDRILAMKRPDGQLAILPMLTVLAPRLERLSVMIDPHTAPVYGGMTAESTRDWINRLAPAEAYCPPVNDGARAQLPGCEPWTVLPLSLIHI